jgi:hypothetical protein
MKRGVVDVENRFMSKEVCQQCVPPNTFYKVVCEHGRIFPFYAMNPYVIFNQQPSLYPDRSSLDQAYFAFQRLLHPDKIRYVSNKEKEWAEQHVGQINHAYKSLQSTLLIAKAAAMYIQNPLIGLESFNEHDIPMLDSEFLNKIMVLQMNAVPNDIDELFISIISGLDNAIKQLNLIDILNAIARLTYVERLRKLIQEN